MHPHLAFSAMPVKVNEQYHERLNQVGFELLLKVKCCNSATILLVTDKTAFLENLVFPCEHDYIEPTFPDLHALGTV